MPQDRPVPQYPSHRPRYKGHDYYERGIYVITIVIAHRDPLFGPLNMDPVHPAVDLTPLGRAVEEEWEKIPDAELLHGRHLRILGKVAMPDHFHGVLFVEERMDVSVGEVIRGFKMACARRWHELTGTPSMAWTPTKDGRPLSSMSRSQRARYYASLPRNQQPLFDDNYDDSVLYAPNQLEAMLAYVHDNPRRAILKARVPQFMQSCLCLTIAGVRYSAFGNFLLLRRPLKAQVFCHRMARMGQLTLEERLANGYTALPYPPDMRSKVRYIDTQAWERDREAWIKAAQNYTVLVTPGISPGERFFACAEGPLLILAPWAEDLDAMPRPPQSPCLGGGLARPDLILPPKQVFCPRCSGDRGGAEDREGPSDYDRFHNMNLLAEQICAMDIARTELSFRVIE